MKIISFGLLVCLLVIFSHPTSLIAGEWPNLEKVMEAWQGDKEVHLIVDGDDPLGDPKLLSLVETLLKHGFAVHTSAGKTPPEKGLVAELRHTQTPPLVVMYRASDHSIVALERLIEQNLKVTTAETIAVDTRITKNSSMSQIQPLKDRRRVPIALTDSPVSLSWLAGSPRDGGKLALLTDDSVSIYRLKGQQLQRVASEPPPRRGMRPLFLSQGDVDNDGVPELAAVWAEDVHDIYAGTDSQVWSELFTGVGFELTRLALLPGYVRLFQTSGVIQQRGPYRPFVGDIRRLHKGRTEIGAGQALPWGGQNIFSLTPWTEGNGLAWLKTGELATLALADGTPLPGGTPLENFGDYHGRQIAIRLETPEFRSGFEKEDKVMETYVSLPPRLSRDRSGSIFTISRDRRPGNLLLGQPYGEDRLVRLTKLSDDLAIDFPCDPVEAFIVDFALVSTDNQTGALLLLNEKEDASGKAFLLYQEIN